MIPTVSVIVTCYNHEKYIEQCLQSIFDQSYSNINLLIIDDGSKDDSAQLIEKKIKNSPFKITEFIKQPNKGVCLTRNIGLEWNKSDFILFVDSDNFLDSNYIEELLNHACKTNTDIIYCDLFDFENKRNFITSKEFNIEDFLKNNFIDNCSLIRSSVVGNIRYDVNLNRKFLVDYDFLLNLILNNKAVPSYCKNTKLNYRILNDSISRKDGHQDLSYYYDVYTYIMHKFIDKYPDEIFHALKENIFVISNRLTELVDHHIKLEPYVQSLKVEKSDFQEKYDQQLSKNRQLNETLKSSTHEINMLVHDNYALRHSKSYKLGNAIIKPIYFANRVVRQPSLLLKAAKRGKSYLKRKIRICPRPSMYLRRFVKDLCRKKYQLATNKRYLIYVIFENQKEIQEYKYLFLDHLSKFVDEVLIISNSQLNEYDMRHLSRYGKVRIRENKGYDTAAFRYGILEAYEELSKEYSELILANDTSIGPIFDFSTMFNQMDNRKVDFWGITLGEEQEDITGYNRYNYIPKHLQSYFLVVRRNMFLDSNFLTYWKSLTDTNSRDEAIGKHETVFTKYFADLGYRYDAYVQENTDSAMYIHPLKMLQLGVPLIKYTALANYDDEQFIWQGLSRQSEIPGLLEYVEKNSQYPVRLINNIINEIKNKPHEKYILIIDGVENIIPQCTRYRVLNKKEYLEQQGHKVKVVNLSDFQLKDLRYASMVIVYRAPYSPLLDEMVQLTSKLKINVYFDIDDLVIDTQYTDQLEYTQQLSTIEKQQYDASVHNYGRMLMLCSGAITSTGKLVDELKNYKYDVYLDRNIASKQLIELSELAVKENSNNDDNKVKIGYFSGSITHNENFNLIKDAIRNLLNEYSNLELHIVGHLDLPNEFQSYEKQIVMHDYVEWQDLPKLISVVDINLAPLKKSIFNEAKSEIKWLEAALVKVTTVASNIGAFAEMINHNKTGVLCSDDDWYQTLKELIEDKNYREKIAEQAYEFVLDNCTTTTYKSELDQLLIKEEF